MAINFGPAISLKGPQGSPGSQIYFGTGVPQSTLGVTNDVFFSTDTNYIYQKTSTGWPSMGTLLQGAMGMTGIKGASFISGTGAPTMAANNGDLYIDLAAGEIYKYSNGAWGDQGYSLKGPQGNQGVAGLRGSQIYTGSGAPNIANYPNAAAGDLYFDTTNGNLYTVSGS